MTNQKVRRSGRIHKKVPILLIGSDEEGTIFSEKTTTVVLSLHGGGILSAHRLAAEQELTLRSLETNQEAEIRVVGEIGAQDKLHAYGVEFVDENLGIWQLEFPPPPQQPAEMFIECASCHTPLTLYHGDFEADVCAIHGGLVRYCRECGISTVWKRAPRRPDSPPPSAPAKKEAPQVTSTVAVLEPLPEVPPDIATPATKVHRNRRQRMRAKVKLFACVRTDAYGDDIVDCVDMSRGGVGFKTRNCYQESALVRIAVPFARESADAPAIFVPARIAHIEPIPGQDMFRCGVNFLLQS